MLIGLVTVVPSSETERPFFFFFSPSCARLCVEWAVSDTHRPASPSPASSQRANQSPGLGGSEKKRAVSCCISPGRWVLGSSRASRSAFHAWCGSCCTSSCLLLFALLTRRCRWPQSQAFLSSENTNLFPLFPPAQVDGPRFAFAPVPPPFGELTAFELAV